MRVLSVSASKGGVGKSTIAAALGVEAARRGHRVVFIDLDPQQSLKNWHDDRKSELPALIKADKYIDRTIEKLRRENWDWVIIDSPPGLVSIIESAVEVADLVLCPVRASPLDTDALDAVMQMVATHEKNFVFLLNAVTPRSKLAEGARKYLEEGGDVLDIEIANRLVYASAMITGKTAAEVDPKGPAAAEIAALFKELEKRMARVVDKKKPARAQR